MAFADQVFYCNAGDQSTTGYYAVAKFAASTTYHRRAISSPAYRADGR